MRKTAVKRYSRTQPSKTSFEISELEFNWFSERTPETIKKRIQSCCPSNHWAIQICQNSSTPGELYKLRSFVEGSLWTNCVASSNRVEIEPFGSLIWSPDEHCDRTCHTTKRWKNPNQRVTITESQVTITYVPSTQKREIVSSKQEKFCWKQHYE